MDSFARLLLRCILVPIGYLAAVTTGAVVIAISQWRMAGSLDVPPGDEPMVGVTVAIVSAVLVFFILLSAMWLVAAVGILFSEAFAVRSWLFHTANGAISAFIGARLFDAADHNTPVLLDPLSIIAAGLAGGLVYWLVAGSTAGFFKPVLPSAAERATRLPPPGRPAALPPAQEPANGKPDARPRA